MGDWAGISEREVQEFLAALLVGALAGLAVWACVDDDWPYY